MTFERVPLAGGWIDRDAATRASAEALAAAWADPATQVLQLHGQSIPIAEGEARLLLEPAERVSAQPDDRLYLGKWEETPVFAVAVGSAEDAPELQHADWQPTFFATAQLSAAERELVVMATALVRWHENAEYSPRDGAKTTIADGGWSRRTADGLELFPRTDPAVIVLIEDDDRVLLGSNALWESGRFSLLAGFVEAGESFEEAVEREVFEESGVRVANMRYIASQPWPFPRSIMVGFHASLASGQDPAALVPAPDEISELRWFTRDEVLSPPPGIKLPGALSIAGWMLQQWAGDAKQ